jgi:hypothetical protein
MDELKITNKLLSRVRSLKHYYDNIENYREYYHNNKPKLMRYNTQYKRNLRKIENGLEISNNKTVSIEHGKFIILV